MEVLTELAEHPQKCAPSIHIAGSKGKGSVTSMISAILTAAGYRTARYMSPHVTDIRERICLGDSFFDEDIYCKAGDELRVIVEEKLPAANNQLFFAEPPDGLPDHEWSGCEPTFWELLTLFFFLCARHAKCDVMVVETGMGGRLDSTNVLDPIVSVITLIELEHTNFLGNSIAEIAGEKAGIIKKGKPLVLAKQCDEACGGALEVFKNKAQEMNSALYYLPEIKKLSNINITMQGTNFDLAPFNNLSIPIPGKVQAENAALAITALEIFLYDISHKDTSNIMSAAQRIDESSIRNGLKNLKIPARFENIGKTLPFIIDGAHTPESLDLCIETFCSLYGKGGVLIFGCAADKDAASMARIAHSHFLKIIVTTPGTFKISCPAKVYDAFAEIAGRDRVSILLNTQEAVMRATILAKDYSLPTLATGSFYLVSEIRKFVI
jgi:dihydrofolate synthase/folylpolyglutamate synthase